MMKWFKNKKISAKLMIGFMIVVVFAVVIGVVGTLNIISVSKRDKELYEQHTATLPIVADIVTFYQQEALAVTNLYIQRGVGAVTKLITEINDSSAAISQRIAELREMDPDPEVQAGIERLSASIAEFQELRDKVIEAATSGEMMQVYSLITSFKAEQISATINAETDALMALKTQKAKEASDANLATANFALVIMIAVVVVAVAAALVLGTSIARMIGRPIQKMAEAAQQMAKGDVDVTIEVNTKDEVGTLAESFQALIESSKEQALVVHSLAQGDLTADVVIRSEKDYLGQSIAELLNKLNEIVATIVQAADQVAATSNLVADSSASLSHGSTEQASSIEELKATIEAIAAQAIQNAEKAKEATELAMNAQRNAAEGNDKMKDMLVAMAEINEASNNISKIIKVIDDIAFQTNILALNAAVEAARAGQYGKGFAVVAEEVRNLAARSASAAKETTDMIENSIRKVKAGTTLANSTAEALRKIVEEVQKAAELVRDISIASTEQSTGVEQINQGVMQISQVVQNNAATSEETAAASEELSGQAAQLKESVSIFRLKKLGYQNDPAANATRAEEEQADYYPAETEEEELPALSETV